MKQALVTFCVAAYNQERFVRDAVFGAFSQTYSPLEIILSDDCSMDRTFQIMSDLAAAYRGPHKVILNRNEKNLGTSAHVTKLFRMIKGDFFTGTAGDDVALPDRTEKIISAFREGGENVQCVWSNATIVDENGVDKGFYRPAEFLGLHNNVKPVISMRRHPWVLGATSAFRLNLFTDFGPLHPSILQEDRALALRAALRGEVHYLPSSLVRYRRHGSNLYDYEKQSCETSMGLRRDLDNKIGLARQAMKDCMLAKTRGWISAREADFYWWSNCRILLVEGVVRHGLLGRNFRGKRFAIKAASKLRSRLLKLDDAARARVFGVVAE